MASVDIDGNDSHIVRPSSAGLAPDVFIVEYNAKFPPGVEFEMPYDERHVFRPDDDFQSASLQQWVKIFADYRLITCNENGANAFFVKRTHSERFADVPDGSRRTLSDRACISLSARWIEDIPSHRKAFRIRCVERAITLRANTL